MSKAKKKAAPKKATALAVREAAQINPQTEPALALVERFARDPHFDVEKMRALLDMRTQEMARVAENEFNQALNRAQVRMRPVATDADNPQTKSRYATYRKLDGAIRPIYTGEGFGISFDTTDSPKGADHVRVLAYVSHAGGFSRTYRADLPADGKGAKGGDAMTKTHAAGAAMSYGMRYLLKMIFNIAIGEEDRDGNRVEPVRRQAPDVSDEPPPIDAKPVPVQDGDEKITNEQRKRLTDIAERAGRQPAEVTLWLKKRFGAAGGSKDVRRKDYAEVCRLLEARGALAMPGDGQ